MINTINMGILLGIIERYLRIVIINIYQELKAHDLDLATRSFSFFIKPKPFNLTFFNILLIFSMTKMDTHNKMDCY